MKNFFLVLLFLFSGSGAVLADNLSNCSEQSAEINKSAPQQIDKITILTNAICTSDGGKVTLQYNNKLTESVDINRLNGLKTVMLNQWCTNPDLKPLFNIINIRYSYMDSKGKFLTNIDLSKKECK
jgi:hypothetical protein